MCIIVNELYGIVRCRNCQCIDVQKKRKEAQAMCFELDLFIGPILNSTSCLPTFCLEE